MNIVDSKIDLHHGDCLEVMPTLEDGSVDMVLADPPYGTTACKWDSVIPLEPMWENLKRLAKKNAAIVMTASQPFTPKLIASNMKMFKYCWVWEKDKGTCFMNAPYQPMKCHEDIVVFSQLASTYSSRGSMNYFPQKTQGKPYKAQRKKSGSYVFHTKPESKGHVPTDNKGERYPRSVLRFNPDRGLHPTQKPVALMEYLIKTYTNEGDTVLDFTMGSGTTGVACKNLGRNFIGIEKDAEYYEIAKKRIDDAERKDTND